MSAAEHARSFVRKDGVQVSETHHSTRDWNPKTQNPTLQTRNTALA